MLWALPRAGQPSSNPGVVEPLQVSLLPPAAAPASRTESPLPRRALPVPPRYFAAHELDSRPQVLSHVEPQFPALALGPTGRVVLRLYINEAGSVDRVAVESADTTGAFEAAAREAFATARFLPGTKAGVPVKAVMRIEVLFGRPHPENAPG